MREFEIRAQHLLEKYQVPGSIVAIAQNGKIMYEKVFGYRNIEKLEPVNRHTVFGLASLTKSFTCAALMQLVEKGKLDLNTPVITYLPHFSIKNNSDVNKITVFHFMTHSSGLPPLPSLDYAMRRKRNDETKVDYLEQEAKQLTTYDELMRFISESEVELVDQPGKLFSYSNDAYGLLGAIIEHVSGMSYEQYVLEYIIKPSGMEHTNFTIEDYKEYENITACYEYIEKEPQNEI